jgi:hypothetical protein
VTPIARYGAATAAMKRKLDREARKKLRALDDRQLALLEDAIRDWPPEPDGFVPFARLLADVRGIRARRAYPLRPPQYSGRGRGEVR